MAPHDDDEVFDYENEKRQNQDQDQEEEPNHEQTPHKQERLDDNDSPLCTTFIYPPQLSYGNLQRHLHDPDSSVSSLSNRSSFDEEKAIGGDDEDNEGDGGCAGTRARRERRRLLRTKHEHHQDEDELVLEGRRLGDEDTPLGSDGIGGLFHRFMSLVRLDLSRGKYVSIGGGTPTSILGSEDEPSSTGFTFFEKLKNKNPCALISVFTFFLIALVVTLFAVAPSHYTTPSKDRLISIDHIFNQTFRSESHTFDWLAEAGDGVYSERTVDGSISLVDVSKNTSRIFVNSTNLVDNTGKRLFWNEFQVSSDLQLVLFSADKLQHWRHSKYSNFYIHHVASGTTYPLTTPSHPPKTSIARFAPSGHAIAYVENQNLFINTTTERVQLSNTGSETFFVGIPDWVYEEEVFASDSAIWWSPDGTKLAYLTFNESTVLTYDFPVYNPSAWTPGIIHPYPKKYEVRYPKPGYPNPIVELHVFDLTKYQQLAGTHSRPTVHNSHGTHNNIEDDEIVTLDPNVEASTYTLRVNHGFSGIDSLFVDLAWLDNSNNIIIKQSNRVSDHIMVTHYDISSASSTAPPASVIEGVVVRNSNYRNVDGGWYEPAQSMYTFIQAQVQGQLQIQDTPAQFSNLPGYLDVVDDHEGFQHIAYYHNINATQPIFLTNGEWEVDGNIKSVDLRRGLIYFIAAKPSTQRHLFTVPLPTVDDVESYLDKTRQPPKSTPLSDTSKPGYYSVSISPASGFYLLSYQGPNVPSQRLYNVDNPGKSKDITTNANLKSILKSFDIPTTKRSTLKLDNGTTVNILEIIPPSASLSGDVQYPVLLHPYGGPNSQLVSEKFSIDWHFHLASQYGIISLIVDGRGTGFRGRSFRSVVRKNLGYYEAIDQIDAAREYSKRSYVDANRVGIWGWSFGGYLTSKVVEQDAGVFSAAMAVAPVTDWLLYDSVYTERYMDIPGSNKKGYEQSAVKDMEGFKHTPLLLAHGTGDDNVHFSNTAGLIDRLTVAKVRNFDFRMFTDSAHSITVRGANRELYEFLESFLVRNWKLKSETGV